MPLASLFGLEWYGPGMLSSIGSVSPTANAELYGTGRMASVDVAVNSSPRAFLVSAWLLASYGVTVPFASASIRGSGRMGAIGKVNELSQDDVTGALMSAKIDGDYSFRDVMRIMAAVLAGKVSGAETATVTFRAITDAKDRVISVTDVDGNRTSVTLDPS